MKCLFLLSGHIISFNNVNIPVSVSTKWEKWHNLVMTTNRFRLIAINFMKYVQVAPELFGVKKFRSFWKFCGALFWTVVGSWDMFHHAVTTFLSIWDRFGLNGQPYLPSLFGKMQRTWRRSYHDLLAGLLLSRFCSSVPIFCQILATYKIYGFTSPFHPDKHKDSCCFWFI